MIQRIIYYALFYISWFVCVQQAANGNRFIGPFLIGVVVLLHFWWTSETKAELIFVCILSVVGTIIDNIYMDAGLMKFEAGYVNFPWIAPLWITSLYALFGAAFIQSFGWLQGRWFAIVLFGAIGGPLCYVAAVKAGAGEFLVPFWVACLILSIVWAILIPLCFVLYNRLRAN